MRPTNSSTFRSLLALVSIGIFISLLCACQGGRSGKYSGDKAYSPAKSTTSNARENAKPTSPTPSADQPTAKPASRIADEKIIKEMESKITQLKAKPAPQPKNKKLSLQKDKVVSGEVVYEETEGEAEESLIEERRDNDSSSEAYDLIRENQFLAVSNNPLSTFSIDVDAASYSNSRRFINSNRLPPKDAVRIEEFVNYFTYDYPEPKDDHPFSITTEIGRTPWNSDNLLLHVGLQGRKIDMSEGPNSNLVFLLDVSGSMNSSNKLPLLKDAFSMLADQMRSDDRVAIVVYAGAAGVVLPSTSFDDKKTILKALDNLRAGGSTAGGAGIKLAYKIAKENYIDGGNNRIILATDGDFNVGASSDGEMVRLIEEKRKSGIFLTVLGFGMGNYKDSKMEKLADKGNGNYAYIDNLMEAKKVLVNEISGTLFAIAKDVKVQIEFNPAKIKSYRLIGYENRLLAAEDFNDDTKDAGELGAGHTVTALYELVPVNGDSPAAKVDPLKYQKTDIKPSALSSSELLTVKFRYKQPEGGTSELIVNPVKEQTLGQVSNNFTFSAAVAGFGMLLRGSKFKGKTNFKMVKEMAQRSKGPDKEGYRAEFIRLVEMSEMLAR